MLDSECYWHSSHQSLDHKVCISEEPIHVVTNYATSLLLCVSNLSVSIKLFLSYC